VTTSEFRKLDESKIVESLTALRDRIENRLPDSGLGRVACSVAVRYLKDFFSTPD
jgi:hypothetical protein